MKKTVVRYGLYSATALVVTGALSYLIFKNNKNAYSYQELGGYVSIILSLVFIYFGIKQYRDKVNGGVISYWQAIQVGLLILIIPSLAFGLYDVIYVKFMDPGFMERYYALSIQKMKASMPPDAFAIKLKQLEQEKAMFENVYFQFLLMSATVFLIGLVVTAISALTLFKKPKALATA